MGSQHRKYCNEVNEGSIFYQFQDNTANVFKIQNYKAKKERIESSCKWTIYNISYPEKGGRTICFLLEATWLCFAIKRDFSSDHSHNSLQLMSTQNIQWLERCKKVASKPQQQQQNLICTVCSRGEDRAVGKRGIIH